MTNDAELDELVASIRGWYEACPYMATIAPVTMLRSAADAITTLRQERDAARAIGPAQERPEPHPEWTVCPRCDNKIAHCDCAHPAPPQTPMTADEIANLIAEARKQGPFTTIMFVTLARAVERHHGIGECR